MIAQSIRFKGHSCFKTNFVGFDEVRPINILIGKNNSGKSQMLDFVEALCRGIPKNSGWECEIEGVLDEVTLRGAFRHNTSGGGLNGDHWDNHGFHFIGKRVSFSLDSNGVVNSVRIDESLLSQGSQQYRVRENGLTPRESKLREAVSEWRHPLGACNFVRLAAERNIRPEVAVGEMRLDPDGSGATNIVRKYLSSRALDRDLIKDALLTALNDVFGSDATFTEIAARQHDDGPLGPVGEWEIYLGETSKGLIPLSKSGSGLKTIILVLLNLLVVPNIDKAPKSKYVFALEELENNLHPGLLRRLLKYVEKYAMTEKAVFFLTTHSSVALDLFGVSPNAQLIHVSHDRVSASAKKVDAHLEGLGVISELGAKPSDLLQANGVIWVEGPSDRIYISHWIELFSGEKFREGRDYQCAFYGGSLLAQAQFATDETAVKELVNLFTLNSNIAVVCDSDRTSATGKGAELKGRVARIRDEVGKLPKAHIWVTDGKEIETYLPGGVIGKAYGKNNVRDPERFERFFASESKDSKQDSYVETQLDRKTVDKVELANLALPHMTDAGALAGRLDLKMQIEKLIDQIRDWNR